MVEGNRSRFHLSDAELQSRKRFVTDSRRTLEDLQKDKGNFILNLLYVAHEFENFGPPKQRREIHETSNVETLKCMKDVNGPQTRVKLENDKKAQGL